MTGTLYISERISALKGTKFLFYSSLLWTYWTNYVIFHSHHDFIIFEKLGGRYNDKSHTYIKYKTSSATNQVALSEMPFLNWPHWLKLKLQFHTRINLTLFWSSIFHFPNRMSHRVDSVRIESHFEGITSWCEPFSRFIEKKKSFFNLNFYPRLPP